MQQDILINWSPQETRVAVVEHGAVQELHIERTLERGQVGNVYLGKVVRVLPGMQSAFVDVGLERAAFLHVADLLPATPVGRGPNGGSNGNGAQAAGVAGALLATAAMVAATRTLVALRGATFGEVSSAATTGAKRAGRR